MKKILRVSLVALTIFGCSTKPNQAQLESELATLDLKRGEITLCGSGIDKFGTVSFADACSEKVSADFDLATALLHSFEYTESEKVFTKVIDQDPTCVMAYWGAAMSNFHPLWEPPSQNDLKKGERIIQVARSITDGNPTKESDYLEAIATIYDDWDSLSHKTRLLKFEDASQALYEKYPDDPEAAVFYSLSLRAASDPADKTFARQKKAGDILMSLYEKNPNHPGITHYIIHTYDYPELAEMALPAARKYASIAAASAHAQHMPSHIFTRLGYWNESVQSNLNSISSAQCYAKNMGISGTWDEEVHGMDYLVYAYLQQGNDKKALEEVERFKSIKSIFPQNSKDAYSFAAMPTRYALERKDWKAATALEFSPADFPWGKYPWEKSNLIFGRLLGDVHTKKLSAAKEELAQLQKNYQALDSAKDMYKANLVNIQIKIAQASILFGGGKKPEAIALMEEASAMEDATEKHPVTPGEIVPARELLGDMYLEMKQPEKALVAYEANLRKHPGRFNGLYGAASAAMQLGNTQKAKLYYQQLIEISDPESSRAEIAVAKSFLLGKNLAFNN